jgi:16S rRNA (cytosine1402-N4)-methyltransferase
LLAEVLAALLPPEAPVAPTRLIDGTLGAAGHATALLCAAPQAHLLGFDRDPRSLEIARHALAPFGARAVAVQANFDQMLALAPTHGFAPGSVDGILLDLGLSSMHLDEAARGFSFLRDGPLDMRLDGPDAPRSTAADLVNTLSADELADLIYQYGEEPDSRRIARAIIAARPLHTTTQLAEAVLRAKPRRERTHPATQTFQALRIAVNDELGAVERVLPQAAALLRPGGRLAVISFHSLEDRLVKEYLRRESADCLCPPKQPVCTCGHRALWTLVTRKPQVPSAAEVTANPRARSAKLRVAARNA